MSFETPLPPGDDPEAQLTALLLGELSEDDAATLRARIDNDPELAALHERLKRTIALVREASTDPSEKSREQPAPLRLSEERRQLLLRQWRAASPATLALPRKPSISWSLPMAIAAMLVALFSIAILLPSLSKSKSRSMSALYAPAQPAEEFAQSTPAPEKPVQYRRQNADEWFDLNESLEGQDTRSKLAASESSTVEELFRQPAASADATTIVLPAQVPANAGEPSRAPADTHYFYKSINSDSDSDFGSSLFANSSGIANGRRSRGFSGGGGGGIGGAGISDMKRTTGMKADFAGRAQEESLSVSPGGPIPSVSIQAPFDDLGAILVPELKLPSPTDSLGIAIDGASPASNLEGETQAAASREIRDPFERGEQVQRGAAPVTPIPATPSPEPVNQLSRQARQELPPTLIRPTMTVAPSEPSANSVALRDVQLETALEEPSHRVSEIIADRYGLTQTGPNQYGIGQNASSPPKSPTPRVEQRLERMEELRQIEEAQPSARQLDRITSQTDELARDKEEKVAPWSVSASLSSRLEGYIEDSVKLQETETRAVAGLTVNGIGIDQNLGELAAKDTDMPAAHPTPFAPIPQPEVQTAANPFSTFSLNVSDVSFKLAAASLEQGVLPDPASIRGEEFLNAFDYRDPDPAPGSPVAFAWERARSPFAHNRDLLRFSVKTASIGRQAGRPLNVVLLLDNSGSMERADRVRIIQEALGVLAGQLQPRDKFSLVTFARNPRLWVDGMAGNEAHDVAGRVGGLTPEGGTNLEEALALAYATALRHYLPEGINRVVLLTDGAANL
ncbi:MAG TPA: von Willebrand factor type A domain-containing protein, partial [Methylomirabilota bacterium]|nr:von Willebrand factor type A domain-containing protein [Methylomirabilota bacterium]